MFKGISPSMVRLCAALAMVGALINPATARADVVLEWNALAVTVTAGNPFTQARFMAITQLAVFEAVNSVTGKYEPYLGTIAEAPTASADAAAIAAAYGVLKNYFPSNALLDPARANSLAAIPDGAAKSLGIATGEAAAAALIANRVGDNSAPPPAGLYVPGPSESGEWQLTPSCTAGAGVFFDWGTVTPFGIGSVDRFIADPPPSLTSRRYTKDYLEVKAVGAADSAERPQDRTDVAGLRGGVPRLCVQHGGATDLRSATAFVVSQRAYARPAEHGNQRQPGDVVCDQYHYDFWRPETAIRAAATDGNDRTDSDTNFAPLILTPCFPSYPSNHASGSYGGAEILERIYGAGRHRRIALTTTVLGSPMTLWYTKIRQITADIDDARVYGGIHFRFDQEAGARLGRAVAGSVYRHNLRRDHSGEHDREDDCEDHDSHGR